MRHHIFAQEEESYKVAVLMKSTSFNKDDIFKHYVDPLSIQGVSKHEVIAFTLQYEEGKAPAKLVKEYLSNLLPVLDSLKVKYLYVTDATYFKALTGQTKADPHFGYVMPCKIKKYEHMNIVLGINYHQLIYNPTTQEKLDTSLLALSYHFKGAYVPPGSGIIHSAQYPETHQDIAQALESLHQYESLTCDIEAFSLRFNEAGIGTIAFAWDKHNGLAFACDYQPHAPHSGGSGQPLYGKYVDNPEVKKLLKQFFMTYKGKITWHNGVYDIKVIIYNLWMKPL